MGKSVTLLNEVAPAYSCDSWWGAVGSGGEGGLAHSPDLKTNQQWYQFQMVVYVVTSRASNHSNRTCVKLLICVSATVPLYSGILWQYVRYNVTYLTEAGNQK